VAIKEQFKVASTEEARKQSEQKYHPGDKYWGDHHLKRKGFNKSNSGNCGFCFLC
jgi:hypothetical protein